MWRRQHGRNIFLFYLSSVKMNGKNAAWHRWLFFFRSLVFQAGKNTSSRWDAGKLASGRLKYGDPEQSLLNLTDPRRFNRHIKMLFILSYLFTYLCCQMGRIFFSLWNVCMTEIEREREQQRLGRENSEWVGVIYLVWSSEKSPAVSLIPSPPGHRTNESTLRAKQTRAVCATLQRTYTIQPLSHTLTHSLSVSRTNTHTQTHTQAEVSATPHPFNGRKNVLLVLLWLKNTDSFLF